MPHGNHYTVGSGNRECVEVLSSELGDSHKRGNVFAGRSDLFYVRQLEPRLSVTDLITKISTAIGNINVWGMNSN